MEDIPVMVVKVAVEALLEPERCKPLNVARMVSTVREARMDWKVILSTINPAPD
jgi:hypothetical protein